MRKATSFRVHADVKLSDCRSDDNGGLGKDEGLAEFRLLHERLVELEELLYSEAKHALLIVFQGMDTSGKDSTIRAVFSGLNPAGLQAVSFKRPTDLELRHDFLWRVHPHTPPLGQLAIFNRSHYEDVVVVRVKKLVPHDRLQARYDHINAFERLLHDEGTTIVKFFLHISKDYQKKRLQKRLDNPHKQWKFNPDDLVERRRWDEYMDAYQRALTRCSTDHAPWYVIPAEKRWYRDLLVTRILVETLEALDMRFPPPSFDPTTIVIE